MHLLPDSMIQLAKEAAVQRADSNRDIVAAYLIGSLLDKDPFLGGSADIDLVFVHAQDTKARRELLSLTPEIHLDIKHNSRREYVRPRELRIHPWLGPEMYDPLLLVRERALFQIRPGWPAGQISRSGEHHPARPPQRRTCPPDV